MENDEKYTDKIEKNFQSIWRLYFANFFLVGLLPVNIDNLLKYLPGTTLIGIGLNTALGLFVGTVSIVLYGSFGDKLSKKTSRKNILLINCCLWVLAGGLVAVVPHFIFIYILFFMISFGAGVFLPIGFSMIGDLYPPKERGNKYGVMQVAGILGLGAGMIVGLIIGNSFGALGWRLAYSFVTIIGVFALIGYFLWGFDPKRGGAEPEFIDYKGQIDYDYKLSWNNTKELFKKKSLAAIYVQVICSGIANSTLATWGIFVLTNKIGVENAKFYATLLSLVVGAGALPGSLIGGKLGDSLYKSGKPRGRIIVAFLGLTIGTLCLIVFYLLPFGTNSPEELVLTIIIMLIIGFIGFCMASFNVGNQFALFTEVCIPENRNAANALLGLMTNLGGIIGNIVLSSMIEQDLSLLPSAVSLVLFIWFFGNFFWIIPYFTYPKEAKECRDALAERRKKLEEA
jgi:predicted MFS family arabinose efflux permease